jgi:hypothetical protein
MPYLAGLAALAASGGCLYYDASNKCGAHMRFSEDAHVCLCDESSVPVSGGCEPCGEGQEARDGKCVCGQGTRAGEDGACEPVAGLGDVCDEQRACEHPTYDYCAVPSGESAGTCTQRCAADADCDTGYTCADWLAEPHCVQFTGVGTACTQPGPDDPVCSGDADYCFMGQCFLRGCTVTDEHKTDDCPPNRKCCDVTGLSLPGATTACVPLTSGVCQ